MAVRGRARSRGDSEEINRIDSSLAEITLAFCAVSNLLPPPKDVVVPDSLILTDITLVWKR